MICSASIASLSDRERMPPLLRFRGRCMPTALITGIAGQDGSYLAELLLHTGYRVIGLVHGPACVPQPRLDHLRGLIELTEGNLLDQHSLEEVVDKYRPAEIYNFAA